MNKTCSPPSLLNTHTVEQALKKRGLPRLSRFFRRRRPHAAGSARLRPRRLALTWLTVPRHPFVRSSVLTWAVCQVVVVLGGWMGATSAIPFILRQLGFYTWMILNFKLILWLFQILLECLIMDFKSFFIQICLWICLTF